MDADAPTGRATNLQLFEAAVERARARTVLAPYDRALLLQLCYEKAGGGEAKDGGHARDDDAADDDAADDGGDAAQDRFAAAFLAHAAGRETAPEAVDAFADHLVNELFLPLKAAALCAPTSDDDDDDDDAVLPVFPPSPMTRESKSGERAAALLALIDPQAAAHLRPAASATATATATAVVDRAWADAFRQFRAVPSTAVAAASGPEALALLRLRAAVAHVLEASGAGTHIDRILADSAVEDLAAGGTTHLGQLMQLRLDGWWNGGRGGQDGGHGEEIWIETAQLVADHEQAQTED